MPIISIYTSIILLVAIITRKMYTINEKITMQILVITREVFVSYMYTLQKQDLTSNACLDIWIFQWITAFVELDYACFLDLHQDLLVAANVSRSNKSSSSLKGRKGVQYLRSRLASFEMKQLYIMDQKCRYQTINHIYEWFHKGFLAKEVSLWCSKSLSWGE